MRRALICADSRGAYCCACLSKGAFANGSFDGVAPSKDLSLLDDVIEMLVVVAAREAKRWRRWGGWTDRQKSGAAP